tara:strand:+ start:918 stop:2357 length:1440 start_codon:yes stop_codon:yes gene_type:complete
MAKSTGGLMGKADASLVASSFKEAGANVPADLKSVYEKNEEAFKTFSTGLTSFYKEFTREEREEKQKTKKEIDRANNQSFGLNNDAIFKATQERLKFLRGKLQDKNIDEIEKQKLNREITRVANLGTDGNEFYNSVLNNSSNILFEDLETNKTFNNLLSDINNNTNVSNVRYDEDKKDYVFGEGEGSITLSELKNKIGFSNIQVATNVNKSITKIGGSKKGMYPTVTDAISQVYNDLNRELKNPNDILSAYEDKNFLGMDTFSVKDLLENRGTSDLSKELYDELRKLDLNADGLVDDKDATFLTPKNYKALVDQINSDSQLKKEVISRTVGAISGSHSFAANQRNNASTIVEEEENKNKFGLDAGTRYFTMGADQNYARIYGRDIENAVETFKSVQDKGSGIFTGYDKVPYKLSKGKWKQWDSETEEFDIEANATAIFTNLGWTNNPKIMEYLKVKGMDYDGDGIIDAAPKKPIEFTTY